MAARSEELTHWRGGQLCAAAAAALERNGFRAIVCETASDAASAVVREAAGAQTVGLGGSLTVASLGVADLLAREGKCLLNHSAPGLSPEEKLEVMRRQQVCDLFLTGANAITLDGRIVNVDGVGNRVAATIFGPKRILLVAGRNKLVDGGVDAALARIRTFAAPPNAFRLGRHTPCAATGRCADCASPERICNVTVVLDKRPSRSDICVVLVNEDLGL